MRWSRLRKSIVRIELCCTVALAFAMFAGGTPARAQTYSVLFNFPPGNNGESTSTLLRDHFGRLYGTISANVACVDGLVYQLKPSGSGWTYSPLHCFNGQDGQEPINYGGLTVGPDGSYYGTTVFGGTGGGGMVFKINPGPMACTTALCRWTLTVLHNFVGDQDGSQPFGNVVFDAAGNLYGTTLHGAPSGGGTVFKMTRSGSNWNESVIYRFTDSESDLEAGVVVDAAGNLYGVKTFGGVQSCTFGCGYIFQLSPTDSGYSVQTIYQFSGGADGYNPVGGFLIDQSGNLYGSTTHGGNGGGGGTIFELSSSAGGWTLNTLCGLSGNGGPQSPLTMDASGNLYGTTLYDGHGVGSVFKATRSGNSWTCSDLYRFNVSSGGYQPLAGVTLDSSGNLYGTTSVGGTNNSGVVWEITQ